MLTWPRYVSIAAIGVLSVGLMTADAALTIILVRSVTGLSDPHGLALIFGTFALVCLLPVTVGALVAFVGLLRRRTYGYVWALLVHICVILGGFLVVASGALGTPGLFLVIALGAGGVAVAVVGLRDASAPKAEISSGHG